MNPLSNSETKRDLWNAFIESHKVATSTVPLFDVKDGCVAIMPYGRNGRTVLKRSEQMESLLRTRGKTLIQEHSEANVKHDGILYMMLANTEEGIAPLYIGKAETFGRGDGNLSANISDLATGNGKFGRWGYNYAYHLGDLSAVTCPGHSADKVTIKYESWRDALFTVADGLVQPKFDIHFWATLWGPECQSVWKDYGATKLAFEEYLVIGVASDVFPTLLLNREGRTR